MTSQELIQIANHIKEDQYKDWFMRLVNYEPDYIYFKEWKEANRN